MLPKRTRYSNLSLWGKADDVDGKGVIIGRCVTRYNYTAGLDRGNFLLKQERLR